MLTYYLANLDELVRRVKFAIVSLGGDYLDGVQYCNAPEAKYRLSYLLFSALQVLSYLREREDSCNIERVVSHLFTLLDLSGEGLEPYNLYNRPSRKTATQSVLWDGESLLGEGTGGLLLGNGLVTTTFTLPTVYEQAPEPSLTSLF